MQLVKQSSVVERRIHGRGILQLEYRANPKTGTRRGPYCNRARTGRYAADKPSSVNL